MLDIQGPNGYRIESDGQCIQAKDAKGKVIVSYHPMQGEVVFGFHGPSVVLDAKEDLAYGRAIMARGAIPLQCEGEV